MATKRATGSNTKFGVESATPGTFTDVAAVKSITVPGVERATADVTALDDDFERVTGALAKWGEIEVVIFFDPDDTAQLALEASVGDAATADGKKYQVAYKSGAKMTFTAVPTSFMRGQKSKGEAMTATFKAKVSGAVTFA